MATQGIISIVKENKVIFKCVAGCNGYNASDTANALKKLNPKEYDLKTIYDVCLINNFGCAHGCLTVQSENDFMAFDKDDELPELYKEKFNDPNFNPRWKHGIAAHTEIIKID